MLKFTKLFWAVDNRGDFPNTQGLSETIKFGDLPYVRGEFKNGYEWASMYPTVGLHVAQDPAWMTAFINNLGPWLNGWCEKDFSGYFDLDFETLSLYWEDNSAEVKQHWHDWNMKNNSYFRRLNPAGYEKFYKDSWNKAMKKFYTAIFAECKKQRPNAKFAVFGTPGISYWDHLDPVKFAIAQDRNNRLHWLWKLQDFLMPALYATTVISEKPDPTKWWQSTRQAIEDFYNINLNEVARCACIGGGKEVIVINCMRNVPLVFAESGIEWADWDSIDLMFNLPRARGYAVATWDAIESSSLRDTMQDFVNKMSDLLMKTK